MGGFLFGQAEPCVLVYFHRSGFPHGSRAIRAAARSERKEKRALPKKFSTSFILWGIICGLVTLLDVAAPYISGLPRSKTWPIGAIASVTLLAVGFVDRRNERRQEKGKT